ncbi:MAG: acyl carrier protein [Deltaproteobacteria bacterium]|nr:MAG: acyl carrier protein [Deltaproteobacteria bacterium]
MSDTVDKVLDLAAKHFGVDRSKLAPDADIFEALGIDSFQAVELTSEVELAFDVEIPDYELQPVRTFAELAAVIDKRR